ncbi:hypothetical protein SNEBB_006560 [Seison nebaliae]|nr:hypothetical protein SNEBB_006560 [Seison nebaliae]
MIYLILKLLAGLFNLFLTIDCLTPTKNAGKMSIRDAEPVSYVGSEYIEYSLVKSKPLSREISSLFLYIVSDKRLPFHKITIKRKTDTKEVICGLDEIGTFLPDTINNNYKQIQGYIFYCGKDTPDNQKLHLKVQYFSYGKNGSTAYQETFSTLCRKEPIVVAVGHEKSTWYLNKHKRKFKVATKPFHTFKSYNVHWVKSKKRSPFYGLSRVLDLTPNYRDNFFSLLGEKKEEPYCVKLYKYFSINNNETDETKREGMCKVTFQKTVHVYLKDPANAKPLLGNYVYRLLKVNTYTNVIIVITILIFITGFMIGSIMFAIKLRHREVKLDVNVANVEAPIKNLSKETI